MKAKGLPVRMWFCISGNLASLRLEPRAGFRHLTPFHQYCKYRRKGYVYHVTVAMMDQIRRAPRSEEVWQAPGASYMEYRRPRNITLRVTDVQNGDVVSVWHDCFAALVKNLAYLRAPCSGHYGLPGP